MRDMSAFTYMASVTTKYIPSHFTSVLHEIPLEQNMLGIYMYLQLCSFLAFLKTYLCYLPLLRNSAITGVHKIAVKVGVAIMGESDLPLEGIDQ